MNKMKATLTIYNEIVCLAFIYEMQRLFVVVQDLLKILSFSFLTFTPLLCVSARISGDNSEYDSSVIRTLARYSINKC